jgi:hypothetical protein
MEMIIAVLGVGVLLMTIYFAINDSSSKCDSSIKITRNKGLTSRSDIKHKFRQMNKIASHIRI